MHYLQKCKQTLLIFTTRGRVIIVEDVHTNYSQLRFTSILWKPIGCNNLSWSVF